MIHIKKRRDPLLPWLNQALNSRTIYYGLLKWGIVFLLIVGFLIPYAIPGNTFTSLGAYSMFVLFPLMAGAFLQGWKGGFITWSIISLALMFKVFFNESASLSPSVIVSIVSFNAVSLSFSLLAGQFFHSNRQLVKAYATTQKQALTDPLTGLPNYRAIAEQMEMGLDQACFSNSSLSFIFLDADHFKQVNDKYGHIVGDVVLRQLGQLVRSVLHGQDIVGRFGGDEFVVLLPKKGTYQASIIAEQIRAAAATMSCAREYVDEGIKVTICAGIATYPKDGSTCNELLRQADRAMYRAKELGRNQVCASKIKEIVNNIIRLE
jgi:diguanylate cyclase (GGDEF)-like protein